MARRRPPSPVEVRPPAIPSKSATRDPAVADPGHASVAVLPGVGPALVALLQKLGIAEVQDLWFHLPLRYEDRTRLTPIRDLAAGQAAQIVGIVDAVERGFRGRPQLKVAIGDDSRATLTLRFFHFNRQQAAQFVPGARLVCYGEVRHGAHGFEMVHPAYRHLVGDAPPFLDECLTPIYPTTDGLGQKRLLRLIAAALNRLPTADALEQLPLELRRRYALSSLRDALLAVHRPSVDTDVQALLKGRHPAQQRLAFEELLAHHLSLQRLRRRLRAYRAPALASAGELVARLDRHLPFAPTGAQRRVRNEIVADLARPVPMLRLLQGDVGSGKTLVAAYAALTAIEAGYQVALVAPTELLAEQHRRSFSAWLAPLAIEPVWLAGKVTGRARAQALAAIAESAPLAIGTHALMQDDVEFARLGLVIVDEQHRFGVHQRLALRDKGRAARPASREQGTDAERLQPGDDAAHDDCVPHQLVLSATPIPRTLAMAAYADLDVSIIDEMPPGRTPVQTAAIATTRRDEVIARIRAACAEGRQAYWVCTMIEEADPDTRQRGGFPDAQAAEVAYAELVAALPEVSIGLVHGRLKPRDKEATMDAFRRGELHLLVATTVIEVGVDVPNASLMVIENAERLGLAQLHQLRGRVGRGSAASSCVLLYQPPLSAMARARIATLRETNDGFRIAEKDLELRGPGELLGTRQAGELAFRVADLARDAALLPDVREIGEALMRDSPAVAERIALRWIGASARYAGA